MTLPYFPSLPPLTFPFPRPPLQLAILLPLERSACSAVFESLAPQRRAALQAATQASGLAGTVRQLVQALHDIISWNLPEQLFSLLDSYQVVAEVLPEVGGGGRGRGREGEGNGQGSSG